MSFLSFQTIRCIINQIEKKEVLIMTDSKSKIRNAKDRIIGKVKEATGKVTKNEELELEGKIQSSKSALNDKAGEIKNNIAGKINDAIDKNKNNEGDK